NADDNIHDPMVETVPEFEKHELLAYEKEMLGLYVSDHPLLGLEEAFSRQIDFPSSELKEQKDGTVAWIGGIIAKITKINTKKGDLMLFLELEDLDGSVEIVVFPGTVEKYKDIIEVDKMVLIKGRLDIKEEEVKLLAQEIKAFNPEAKGGGRRKPSTNENGNRFNGKPNGFGNGNGNGNGGRSETGANGNGANKSGNDSSPVEKRIYSDKEVLVITVSAQLMTRSFNENLKDALTMHPGIMPVFLKLANESDSTILKLGEKYRISPQNGCFADLEQITGDESLEVVEACKG
ncbi:MAG: hypothetical protein HY779_01155, partial [Rubrobacteridae bacterium]|nr:hypothetical protein [Rubrobacteridae bacterium]